ncbi:MAG: hypothetical protein RL140_660 [Actinomycetota bacterium]|jgi:hypothetical protein
MDKKKIAKTAGIAAAASVIAALAFTTPSLAATAKPKPAAVSTMEQGKGGHGKDKGFGQGQQGRPADVSQDITVTVPDDGATYKLVVTQTAPAAAANNTTNNAQPKGPENHSIVVAVTGTGSVTVTVPGLHPGTYTAELVKVASSQSVTVAAPAASTTGTTATK